MSFVPKTYGDWKHCITVKCDIPLTPDYVAERFAELKTNQIIVHRSLLIVGENTSRPHIGLV